MPDPVSLSRAITAWFGAKRRPFPWRPPPDHPRDPYHALVSELMLQQTQASRVAERFVVFIDRFPTVADLAAADESEVLALWSGLGYYRRARLLHAAAKAVVATHGGVVPDDPAALRALPGVGRYTAGAIASITFGQSEPIVDGNVARVLLRIHGKDTRPDAPGAEPWLWDRATELVRAADDPGGLNEGLMELGATVCTPRAPACDRCPVRDACDARAAGMQEDIPRPKKRPARSPLWCDVVLARDARSRVLIEPRPVVGLWGGLWQAPTLEAGSPSSPGDIEAGLGVAPGDLLEEFEHLTTNRTIGFRVWAAARTPRANAPRRWATAKSLDGVALSSPQRRILLGNGA